MSSLKASFVLVTPTRDEEKTIGETINSVIAQTYRPAEWVIVSDGSTDRTDAIIQDAQKDHSWIKLIKLPQRKERCFGAVARATKIATEELTVQGYEFIGLLDSDLRFKPDYFEKVISEFRQNPKLGLAGGRVLDPTDSRDLVPDNKLDVPGAVQFFRRTCFEKLSDIHAIPEGGWDMLTCLESRMNGFDTRLLVPLVVEHLKPRNIAHGSIVQRRWQCGVRDYVLGYHPIFETVKCLRRIKQKPLLISAASWWLGYMAAYCTRKKKSIPDDLLKFIRKEQKQRLHNVFKFGGKKTV